LFSNTPLAGVEGKQILLEGHFPMRELRSEFFISATIYYCQILNSMDFSNCKFDTFSQTYNNSTNSAGVNTLEIALPK
jgi:hypothetical protein